MTASGFRFGQGSYIGLGLVTYGTITGKNSDVDFLLRAMEGSDSLEYKREIIPARDLSDYDELIDQVQPGEEKVEGSLKDKCTYGAMQDLIRAITGANPSPSGSSPTTYSFTSTNAPKQFSDPAHYIVGTSPRGWLIEMYRGVVARSTTETQANTGNLTLGGSFPSTAFTITRASGTWDTNIYRRGAIVTITGSVGASSKSIDGTYVVNAATTTQLTLRTTAQGWACWDFLDTSASAITTVTISAVYYSSLYYQSCEIKKLQLDIKRNDWVERSLEWMGKTYTSDASSHSYRTAATIRKTTSAGPAAGTGTYDSASFSGATIILSNNGGSPDAVDPWTLSGYVVGGTVVVTGATTTANNGTYRIVSFDSTNGRTATVQNLDGSAVSFTGESWATGTYITGNSMTGTAKIFGVGTSHAGATLGLWAQDYAVSNPGQATKFLTLGGTAHICREATFYIEDPLEERYDIGQSSGEQPLPNAKRKIMLDVTIETGDETFVDIVNRPDTKSFGAAGAPSGYTGTNQMLIQGAGSTANSEIRFTFPRLTIEGPAETKVESIGVQTVKLNLMARSDGVTPAYTAVIKNGETTYRT